MEKMEMLEEKIRKAADLIRSLKDERGILEDQLRSARDEVRRLSLRKEDPEIGARLERLMVERQAMAARIEHMIQIIEDVEAS